MSFVPRATLIVACAAAALATTSTAAESWPSGGASLTAGASPIQPDPASPAGPVGGTAPTGAAPLTGGTTATIAPALPAPIHSELAQSTVPSGGVALLPLAHIAARLAPPRSDGTHKTWTVRVDGRQLTFNELSRP
ncbi:MAG TPA: hypothetical protein VGX45_13705 [Solirubrobacteraceae bacterium]|jgi:hypothetical protein|nr:hypothetical protein [Solirubrobacteraceae bacterium]